MKIKFVMMILIIWCVTIISAASAYAATDTLVFVTVNPSDTNVYKVSKAVLTEALKRNNLKLVLETYPPKRAELLLNLGKVDGDSSRIYEFNKSNPNLIRVSEPVQSIQQSVFSKRSDIKVDGWESLAPYKVIFVTGIKISENGVRKVVEEEHLIPVDAIETAFRMLERDRGDLLVTSTETGFAIMKKLSLENSGIKLLTPPIVEIYLYAYLHKKREELAPKIADTLKAMKEDGSYQKIIEQTAGEK